MNVIDYSVAPTDRFNVDTTTEHLEDYTRLYKFAKLGGIEKFIDLLDEAGISHAVVKARDVETTHGLKIPNEYVAELVKQYPKRLLGHGRR